MLNHKHDENPEVRPDPIGPDKREDLIAYMAAGLVVALEYFRARMEGYTETAFEPESRRKVPKIGRNDRAPADREGNISGVAVAQE
jgi:uncharacterized protein